MQRVSRLLGWKKRSEFQKTLILIIIVVGGTLSGFGLFTIAMGTSSPLVVVTSGSMSPTLERGHLLVLQKRAPDNILVGDIIVFNATWNSDPVVHRVVRVEVVDNETRWYTQGDNRVTNPSEDPGYRDYNDIIGVVVSVIPYLGYITLYLHTPLGFASVVVLLLVFLIVPELLIKGKDGDEEQSKDAQIESEQGDDTNQRDRQQDL